jgi:hypothetical protein
MAGPALARPAAPAPAPGRRAALAAGALLLAARGARPPPPASPSCPPPCCATEYWLVRAGESVAEAEGYVLSTPPDCELFVRLFILLVFFGYVFFRCFLFMYCSLGSTDKSFEARAEFCGGLGALVEPAG